MRLLSASEDSTSKVWDLTTKRELLTFHDRYGRVFGAAWSRDGESIATAGSDGALKLRRAPRHHADDQREWITLFEDDFNREELGEAWARFGVQDC